MQPSVAELQDMSRTLSKLGRMRPYLSRDDRAEFSELLRVLADVIEFGAESIPAGYTPRRCRRRSAIGNELVV
jgi:hypothetical protein